MKCTHPTSLRLPDHVQGPEKGDRTTAPDRIRKSSPTLLLAGRYPVYLRRADGMRSFLDSVAVDVKTAFGTI